MIQIDDRERRALENNQSVYVRFTIYLQDGTTIKYSDLDGRVVMSTLSIDSSSSPTNVFQIGQVIPKTISFTIANYDGFFDGLDFRNCQVKVGIAKPFYIGTTEATSYHYTCKFYVDEPYYGGNTIQIKGTDILNKAGSLLVKDCGNPNIGRLLNLVSYCANALGISYYIDSSLDIFSNYSINSIIEYEEGTTIKQILQYVCEVSCTNAYINSDNVLCFRKYDKSAFDEFKDLDGGGFNLATPSSAIYTDGDYADGGNFSYNETDNKTGGEFTDMYRMSGFSNIKLCSDDIAVCMVEAYYNGSFLFGSNGDFTPDTEYKIIYVINNNPILNAADSDNKTVLKFWWKNHIVGLRFRTFTGQGISDFTLEVCDPIRIIANGKIYNTYLTHINYKANQYSTYESTAESLADNEKIRANAYKKNTTSTTSDERLKTDIEEIDSVFINLVQKAIPRQYHMKNIADGNNLRFGFIAQEMESICEGMDEIPFVRKSSNGIYSLEYQDMIALLWRYIQIQDERIKALEEKGDN